MKLFTVLSLAIVFMSCAGYIQQPIIRPSTSTARMKDKYARADTARQTTKSSYYLQIGGAYRPPLSYHLDHLGEEQQKNSRKALSFYVTNWFGVNHWLDIGISGELVGSCNDFAFLPSLVTLHAQCVQESFFKPAIAIQTHAGVSYSTVESLLKLRTTGIGLAMSKSILTCKFHNRQYRGALEFISNVYYYDAVEIFEQWLPTLEGIQKLPDERDYSDKSKDFFYAYTWIKKPFVMIPAGIELRFAGVRVGFFKNWRFYLNKNAKVVYYDCDSTCENTNCEDFHRLLEVNPSFIKNFDIEDKSFQVWRFYLAFSGKGKHKNN